MKTCRYDEKGSWVHTKDAHEYCRISHAHRQYAVERHRGIGVYYDITGIKATQEQWQHGNQLLFCEL